MNIQDIMRGLPFPVQGLLMQAYGMTGNQQPQQNAGGGRGFVNPPLVNPNAAPPQMPRVQPSRPVGVPKDEAGFEDVIARIMAGGSTDELRNAPAVEAPTPVQAAMQPDLPAPAAQETAAAAPQAPAAPEGLLSRFGFSDGNQAMGAIGAALAAAGSADPAKTALAIQAQRGEEAKIAEARRRANMPKREQITGTPIAQIIGPNGELISEQISPTLAAFYKAQSEGKTNAAIEKAVLEDRLARGRDQGKADIKASEAARAGLQDTQSMIDRYKRAYDIVMPVQMGPDGKPVVQMDANGQPVIDPTTNQPVLVRAPRPFKDQAMALPFVKNLAEMFGAKGAGDNLELQEITVDETLLKSAESKGAISNYEAQEFKSPLPKPWADPSVWAQRTQRRLEILSKIEKYQQGELARSSAPPPATSAPAPAAPAAGGLTVPGLSPRASRYFQ